MIKEVMSPKPASLDENVPCTEAAKLMRDKHIGAILVTDEQGSLCGILTDRDIAVRCVAEGKDPHSTSVGSTCTRELARLSPDDDVHIAVELMKKKAIRRIPVLANGEAVGIVSMGDLAECIDPDSALGQVSSASPN
jgi:CBS domain-containing protein